MTASIITDPDLTLAIRKELYGMLRNAHILSMNNESPLLLKKSSTVVENLNVIKRALALINLISQLFKLLSTKIIV